MPEVCVLCHAEPGDPVGSECLQDIDRQLRDLPGRYARLAGELAPGNAPGPERVSGGTKVHAGLPARLGALSMVGPGGEVPLVLHPLVRHWCVTRKVQVTMHVVGIARTTTVQITDWFHEAIRDAKGKPVMAESPDVDQVGIVPPREWLDMQVLRVRAIFGHKVPPRTKMADQRAWLPPAYRTLLRLPGGPAAIGFLAAVHQAYGGPARMAYRGLLLEHPDPVVATLERRDGPMSTMHWDVTYLRNWLPRAISLGAVNPAVFAAQLGALHAEISAVLGETPDRTWVGRCPAFIAELGDDGEPTGRKKPCGGGLWQENGAYLSAQVQCPRCRTTWDTRGAAGASTAREIRRVWPIDRRRRYTAAEVDRLQRPKCNECGKRVKIRWREATGTHDRSRTWQPIETSCPDGCTESRRIL